MYYLAVTQQTITLKFYPFFIFLTEQRNPRVNKSQIIDENTFNRDHFEIEGTHGSSKDKKALFWVFLQICDQCFNP